MSDYDLNQEPQNSSRIELGQILKKAREQLGLSHEDVAAIIRIRVTLLKNLEAGDYAAFTSVTYIKGFIKTYAKFLKIPFEPLFELYEKEPHEKIHLAPPNFTNVPKSKKGPNKKIIFGVSFCLIALALINIDWHNVKSLVEEHYEIPSRFTQSAPKDIESSIAPKIIEENTLISPIEEESIDNTKKRYVASIEPLTSFGDERIFLIEIPKTNNPVLKPDKVTLVPTQNTWIELYNGEELLLRTELKSIQNYLMPKNEVTTLLIKGNNNIKIFNAEKEINLEKSLTCDDYHCNLIEVAG